MTRKKKTDREKLAEIRKTVREFLREIEWVPFRAVDCDQDALDRLESKLIELSGYRGPRD